MKALRPHHPHPTLIIPTSDFSTPQWPFLFCEILRDLDRYANMIRTLRTELNGLVQAGKTPWGDPSAATKYKNCRGAGSINTKPGRNHYQAQWYDTGEVHDVRKIELDLLGMKPATHIDFGARLNGATPAPAPTKTKGGRRGANGTEPEDRGREALAFLDPSMGYTLWLQVGMALHHWNQVRGLDLWESWSQGGSNYEQGATARAWRSFKPGKTTIATLFHMAQEAGWDAKASHRKQVAADYDTEAALMKTIEAGIEACQNQKEINAVAAKIKNLDLSYNNSDILVHRIQKKMKAINEVKPKIANVRAMIGQKTEDADDYEDFAYKYLQPAMADFDLRFRFNLDDQLLYLEAGKNVPEKLKVPLEITDTLPMKLKRSVNKTLKTAVERHVKKNVSKERWDQYQVSLGKENHYQPFHDNLYGIPDKDKITQEQDNWLEEWLIRLMGAPGHAARSVCQRHVSDEHDPLAPSSRSDRAKHASSDWQAGARQKHPYQGTDMEGHTPHGVPGWHQPVP